jgi:hypothetical protein
MPGPDWPLWTPPLGSSPEEERAWVEEGDLIRRILERELGQPGDYDV